MSIEKSINRQEQLAHKTQEIFLESFGYPAENIIQAPGRVNIIGEHTDYNDGFVLPCAIDYQTVVAVAKRDDNLVRVIAADYQNQQDTFELSNELCAHPDYLWSNYIRGVIKLLLTKELKISGVDIVLSGNIPQGAGLSSSASLEVVIGQTFKQLFNLPLSQEQIALIGQQAENDFVGCNCGIMDQLISAKGEQEHALLLDCRTLETQTIKIPDNLSILIVNSNVKRGLVDSEYNLRREQCEQAAQFFNVSALRDVTIEAFENLQDQLPAEIAKRARHVISENDRTLAAASALQSNDINTLGQLMAESHQSMSDDFNITVPEIDFLVTIIKEVIGSRGGVRMTGGGFGGCVVSLIPKELIDIVCQTVSSKYQQQTGLTEDIYVCHAMSGASMIG